MAPSSLADGTHRKPLPEESLEVSRVPQPVSVRCPGCCGALSLEWGQV